VFEGAADCAVGRAVPCHPERSEGSRVTAHTDPSASSLQDDTYCASTLIGGEPLSGFTSSTLYSHPLPSVLASTCTVAFAFGPLTGKSNLQFPLPLLRFMLPLTQKPGSIGSPSTAATR